MNIPIRHFEILVHYPYPSFVRDILCDYSEVFGKVEGDKYAKRLYEAVIEKVKGKTGKNLTDNKTGFKLRHIGTGTILYVGYKDNHWKIGLSCENEFGVENELKID